MKKIEPNQKTDEQSGGARVGDLQVEIPEELFFFSNPCVIAEYDNGIIVYDCYVTDGSNLMDNGKVEIVVARKLSFIEGEKPSVVSNLGYMVLTSDNYKYLHFYMEHLISKAIKSTKSMKETEKWFKKIINKK